MNLKKASKKYKLLGQGYKCFRETLTIISPTLNTKVTYRLSKGESLNLKKPTKFDEKISWLKLNTYYKNPLVSQCADKYFVREYVSSMGCEEILNKLYGVYDSVEDIPWSKLPNKFVLKWNMGAGSNIICQNKEELDIEKTKEKLRTWGKKKYYLLNAEMQYKYMEPKILCEKLLETEDKSLPEDYKVYCFNGIAKFVMVCVGRQKGKSKFYLFDREWNLMRINKDGIAAPTNFYFPKPKGIEKMFNYAEKLSKPFIFVRSDFYNIKGEIIFGELTFTPAGGIDSNMPDEMDRYLGEMIKLN